MGRERTQFKKGQSGNPHGRPKSYEAIREFRETTYKDFLSGLQKFGKLSRTEMQAELQRPDATMFEIMFGQIVASAAKGDKDARQVLLERLWGKVKNEVRLEATSVVPPKVVLYIPKNGREAPPEPHKAQA